MLFYMAYMKNVTTTSVSLLCCPADEVLEMTYFLIFT